LPHSTEIAISGAIGIVLALAVELWWRHLRGKVSALGKAPDPTPT
jgi:hypothetical protein